MINSIALVRSIFGLCRADLRPLAYAIDQMEYLVFVEKVAVGEVRVTEDVYPAVARRMKGNTTNEDEKSMARRIERLANKCRDLLLEKEELKKKYLGKEAGDSPADLILGLACYLHYEKSFQEVIGEDPNLAF